jgi:hypothetical protein
MPWSEPLALLLRAGIAVRRGDPSSAVKRLTDAASRFDAAGMGLFAAVARCRQGELMGGESGRLLRETALTWMKGQRIQDPNRMAAAFAPWSGQR